MARPKVRRGSFAARVGAEINGGLQRVEADVLRLVGPTCSAHGEELDGIHRQLREIEERLAAVERALYASRPRRRRTTRALSA